VGCGSRAEGAMIAAQSRRDVKQLAGFEQVHAMPLTFRHDAAFPTRRRLTQIQQLL